MLITLLEGAALEQFLAYMRTDPNLGDIRSLRIHQSNDGKVQFKINGGMWSAPVAGIDPGSDLAIRRAEVESGRIRVLTEP